MTLPILFNFHEDVYPMTKYLFALLLLTSGISWTQSTAFHENDAQLLDSLVDSFLLDPTNLERAQVRCTKRSVWADEVRILREGWLDRRRNCLYFTDGDSLLLTVLDTVHIIDFVQQCALEFQHDPEEEGRDVFERMDLYAHGISAEHLLTKAAWLFKLGQYDLASFALERARQGYDNDFLMIEDLKEDLIWSARADMIHAYMVRADSEAWKHGQRLLKLYDGKSDDQVSEIMNELDRRRQEGTFGMPAPEKPKDYSAMTEEQKISFLIQQLHEVDARQWGQPGGIDFSADWRVQELIALGEAAVPALIEVVESDTRLTRSVHFWRDFSPNRTVIGVHEVAVVALTTILQVDVFDPVSTGDNLSGRGWNERQKIAAEIRQYWDKFGGIPYHARQMNVLLDPNASLQALKDASYKLSHISARQIYGTTVWSDGQTVATDNEYPTDDTFSKSLATEAILLAFDRSYKEEGQENDNFILDLAALCDSASYPILFARFNSARTISSRRCWAYACLKSGDVEAMNSYAHEVKLGKIKTPGGTHDESVLPGDSWTRRSELKKMISFLAFADLPACEEALRTLSNPSHPFFEVFKEGVISYIFEEGDMEDRAFVCHPNCLPILLPELKNDEPTGRHYWISGESIVSENSSEPLRPILKEDANRRDTVIERRCDIVANDLAFYTFGLPWYNIMLSNRDAAIQHQLDFLSRYPLRKFTEEEFALLEGDLPYFQPLYIADIPVLKQAATREDVDQFRAAFHLDGKGQKLDIHLPQYVIYTGEVSGLPNNKVILLQAEIDQNGQIVYGILSDDGLKRVHPDQLIGVEK